MKPPEERSTSRRFVALHPEVVDALVEWAGPHQREVEKFLALMKVLLGDDERMVHMLMKRNAVQSIKGARGLFEIGPKRGRGGLPRLFLQRIDDGTWFVAAGIEKSGRGAKEISRAKARAEALSRRPAEGAGEVEVAGQTYHLVWSVGELQEIASTGGKT